MAYGVTVDGFIKKLYEVILNEKKADALALFGADADLTDTSPLYKFIQVCAFEEANLWNMAEGIYYSGFVSTATGASLDKLGELLSIIRIPANKATVNITFNGINGTFVGIGQGVQTIDGITFQTTTSGTIAGGTLILAAEAMGYGIGWNVSSSTITQLVTGIPGVTSITNVAAASGGTDIETDAALRLRIKLALEGSGNATIEAITQAVLAVAGVTEVLVIENLTLHNINVVVKGPAYSPLVTDPVYVAIDETRAAGIAFTWQNPTGVTCYASCTVDVNQDIYPTDAITQIEQAITTYINDTLGLGDDVIYAKLYDVIYNVGNWVIDVTALTLDTVTPPVATVNIVISNIQEAETVIGNITATINPISPP